MFKEFKDLTINDALEIFDSIFDSEISQDNPGADYAVEFGKFCLAEVLRDIKLGEVAA